MFTGLSSATGVSNFAGDLSFTLLFAALFIIVAAVAVWLLYRYMEFDGSKLKSALTPLFIILGVGIVLRLVFTFVITGYREDYNVIADTVYYISTKNIADYYNNGNTLYPLTFFIYLIFGGFSNLVNASQTPVALQFFIKLPLIICDCGLAVLLYKTAAKYINKAVGLILAGFVMVCPLFIMLSSVWVSIYTLTLFALTLTFVFVASKNHLGAILSYTAALMTAFEAIYIFPLLAVYLGYNAIRAVLNAKEGKVAFKDMFFNDNTSAALRIPLYIIGAFMLSWVISLPMYGRVSFNPFVFMYNFYLKPLSGIRYFTYNGLSIFAVFARNGAELDVNFPIAVFAVIFAVIITAVVLLVYLSKRNRANLSLLAAYALITMSVYFVGSNAMTSAIPLGLMLLAFSLIRDKRIMQIAFITGFCSVLNASLVMMSAGYLNNNSDYLLQSSVYTGTTKLAGAYLGLCIALSIITVITHLYFTLVMLDMSVSDRRKKMIYLQGCGFTKAIREFIRIKDD